MRNEERQELVSKEPCAAGHERRRFRRFDVNASARIEIMGPTNRKRAMFLRTANISAQGAYFPTKKAFSMHLPMKMDIFLNFDLRNENTADRRMFILSVTGEVARVERSGMAVRFNTDYELNPVNMKLFAKN